MNEEQFLNRIAERLGRPRITNRPEHPLKGAPEFWKTFSLPREERIRLFIDNWRQTGGKALHCRHIEEAWAYIADVTKELAGESAVVGDLKDLSSGWSDENLSHMNVYHWDSGQATGEPDARALISLAAEAAAGVIAADYAVAYTGTVVTMSGPVQGRTVSLLPPTLVVLVPADRVMTKLGDVLAELDESGRERLPAGTHFISGPSRSADIENDLTIGVHGPGDVHALIVG